MEKLIDWFSLYQKFLSIAANADYVAWKNSHPEKKVLNQDNPYNRGYSQPNWMRGMREDLSEGDEERVKYIFMVESDYHPYLLDYRKAAEQQIRDKENEETFKS